METDLSTTKHHIHRIIRKRASAKWVTESVKTILYATLADRKGEKLNQETERA